MSAFARVYFPAREMQAWKKISLSKEGGRKKNLKIQLKGPAEQERRRGAAAEGMCAAAERFRAELRALQKLPAP